MGETTCPSKSPVENPLPLREIFGIIIVGVVYIYKDTSYRMEKKRSNGKSD